MINQTKYFEEAVQISINLKKDIELLVLDDIFKVPEIKYCQGKF